jgi:hypothetical protein
LLDILVFCTHGQATIRDVIAGGRWVIQNGQH